MTAATERPWAEIARRASEAKGADWQIDADLLRLCGGSIRRVTKLGLAGRTKGGDRYWPPGTLSAKGYPVPKPSGSVDAILALIAETLPDANYRVERAGGNWRPGFRSFARVSRPYSGKGDHEDGSPSGKGEGATDALALVAAFALADGRKDRKR